MDIIAYFRNKIVFYWKTLFRKVEIFVGRFGIKYSLDPNSSLDSQVKNHGILDDWHYIELIKNFIPEDGKIFDIGANVGLLSLPFAKLLVPNGDVFAYEPDPQNYAQLSKNISINCFSNIHTCSCAIQDDPTIKNISLNIRRAIDGDGNENRGISSLRGLPKFKKSAINVAASTLDLEVKRLNIDRLDLIKIDVEGAEAMVIAGGLLTINKFRPIVRYEYSNILDKMLGDDNAKKSFLMFESLGYKQFVETAGKLASLSQYNSEMPDVNVVCIPQEKIMDLVVENIQCEFFEKI